MLKWRNGHLLWRGGHLLTRCACCGGTGGCAQCFGCCIPRTLTITFTGTAFGAPCTGLVGQSVTLTYDPDAGAAGQWRGTLAALGGTVYITVVCSDDGEIPGEPAIGISVNCVGYLDTPNSGSYWTISEHGSCDPFSVEISMADFPEGIPMGGNCDSSCAALVFFELSG